MWPDVTEIKLEQSLGAAIIVETSIYSRASDNGPSEKRTTSLVIYSGQVPRYRLNLA